MPLTIRRPEADRLARELCSMTGETITAAVTRSLREKLGRVKRTLERAEKRKKKRRSGT
jgi:antitoxin VapB